MAATPPINFTLEHIVGSQVSLADYRGQPVLLLFGNRQTGEQARQLARAIRAQAAADGLAVLTIIDLGGLPGMVRPLVKRLIRQGYDEAVQEVVATLRAAGRPVPDDPAKVVVLLLDWEGAVTRQLAPPEAARQAVALLVGADGVVRGTSVGEAQLGTLFESLLDQ